MIPPLQAGMQKCFTARRPAAVEFAEDQALHRSRLSDDTRAIERSRDVADPTHDLRRAICGSQRFVLEYAVLERDQRRARSNHRLDLFEDRLGVPQLDSQQHEVGHAEISGIV